MKIKITASLIAVVFFSSIMVSQLIAAASPSTKARLQKKSPEKLEIEVKELVKETKKGYTYLEVSAKVLKVNATATKIKVGDEIKIIFSTPTDEARRNGLIPPGDWAKEIVKGKKYSAYLSIADIARFNKELEHEESVKDTHDRIRASKESVYRPSSVSASFLELKK